MVGFLVAAIPLEGNKEFSAFIRRKTEASLTLDELIVLRFLYDKENATFAELYAVMQRSTDAGQKVLQEMFRKLMIEPVDGLLAGGG